MTDTEQILRFREFQRLWKEYQAILAEPTFTMSLADREANDHRLGEVFTQLTKLAKEG